MMNFFNLSLIIALSQLVEIQVYSKVPKLNFYIKFLNKINIIFIWNFRIIVEKKITKKQRMYWEGTVSYDRNMSC